MIWRRGNIVVPPLSTFCGRANTMQRVPLPRATVFRVKRFFVVGGNFIDGAVWMMRGDEQCPDRLMVARTCRENGHADRT
jgi:hypothetical protein